MKKRSDKQRNQKIIIDSMMKHYKFTGFSPTQEQLANITGLSTRTIRRYKSEILKVNFPTRSRSLLVSLMDHVVMALLNSAMKGNMRAIRMCFILAYDYDPLKRR